MLFLVLKVVKVLDNYYTTAIATRPAHPRRLNGLIRRLNKET